MKDQDCGNTFAIRRKEDLMRRIPVPAMVTVAACLAGATITFGVQPQGTEVRGGRGGYAFFDPDPPAGARVAEVRLRTGDRVDSVQLVFALPNGRMIPGPRNGGSGGRLRIFRLSAGEYIAGISGRHGDGIDSIRIHTNRRTSPLYGGNGGTFAYRIEVPPGAQAVGFRGRAGDYLDAVGLVFARAYEPVYAPRRRDTPPPISTRPIPIVRTDIAGGRGGIPFADPDFPAGGRLAEIRVLSGERIDAIQAVYRMPDGRFREGAYHGGTGGRVTIFRLDPDEYVTGISGRCGDRIDSLRIHTNKRTSPLFGGRGGNRSFRIQVPRGSMASGFAGRAGDSLDALGLIHSRLAPIRR
jgi:hypothetical protein